MSNSTTSSKEGRETSSFGDATYPEEAVAVLDTVEFGDPITGGRRGRAEAILESMVDFAVIATDLDGIITEWNPGAEFVFGWTAREVSGRSLRIVDVEADPASRFEDELRLSRTAGRLVYDQWQARADGSRFWASGYLLPLIAPTGRQFGYLNVVRDRTEDHLARMALVDADTRARMAADLGGIGFWEMGVGTRALTLDSRAREAFGVADENATLQTILDRLHADDRDRLSASIDRSLTDDTDLELRARIVGADDEVVCEVEFRARRSDRPGGPSRLVGAVRRST